MFQLFWLPAAVTAQDFDLSLKLRASGFGGKFGENYNAIGYEPSVTIRPTEKPWAGGLSYSQNILAHDGTSDLDVEITLMNVHAGARFTIAKYFHPFAYALLGFRFMDYENNNLPDETSPVFSSFTLGYGGRAGLQIGKNKWRFETHLEYLTGTSARYLTPAAFRRATEEDEDYRDYTYRSPVTAVTIGAGIAYVLDFNSPE